MTIQIIKKPSPEYESLCLLRDEVLRKPIGLRLTEEDRQKDTGDILVGCIKNDQVIACCILSGIDSKTVKFRQMAVHEDYRGKNIGAEVLEFAELTALENGYMDITMHARKVARGFYEKYRYKIIGEEFTEVGIPHFEMQKSLEKK